jgi:hypothetical protein
VSSERSPLTNEDVQKAREQLEDFFRAVTTAGQSIAPERSATKIVNNDNYMEVKLREGHELHGKKVIKMKTVFHSVEENIEDTYGGVFKCTYNIRNTVAGLHEWILDKYPAATVSEIETFANERELTFEEAKKMLALSIAEAEFWLRIKMAKFLHEQLKPALEITISDLIEDVGLYGLSEYGCKLSNSREFDKATRGYIRLRKQRTNTIEGVGKRWKAPVSTEEVNEFVGNVFSKMQELESGGKKINSNAVARKIISTHHSNPLKVFKDKLKRYDLSFEDLREGYPHIKSEQNNR